MRACVHMFLRVCICFLVCAYAQVRYEWVYMLRAFCVYVWVVRVSESYWGDAIGMCKCSSLVFMCVCACILVFMVMSYHKLHYRHTHIAHSVHVFKQTQKIGIEQRRISGIGVIMCAEFKISTGERNEEKKKEIEKRTLLTRHVGGCK